MSAQTLEQPLREEFAASKVQWIADAQMQPGDCQVESAGTVVDVQGAGATFSGPYYVTSVTHTLTPDSGFRTDLAVRRSAA